VKGTGTFASADLGSSSDYSNEFHYYDGCRALKTVVEKVSLRAALGQGLVGPKG
jgi:hypothetical protein